MHENKSSMISQAYDTLKNDSIQGDFKDLVIQDMEQLCITLKEEDIHDITKIQLKKYIHDTVSEKAFNIQKKKIRQILKQNISLLNNSKLVIILFRIRKY